MRGSISVGSACGQVANAVGLRRPRPPSPCAGRLASLLVLSIAMAGCTPSAADQDRRPAAAKESLGAAPLPKPAYAIAPGHPRILLSDDATRKRLTRVLDGGSAASRKFQDQVDAQLLGRRAYAFQPWYAALLFQLTGEKRYAAYAVEETEKFVAAEEALIARGQRPAVAGDSYLEIGQVVGNVALVYDWCHELLTKEQRQRWTVYANQAVWNVWNHRKAQWGGSLHPWTGWSVDNPSNNYYYSFLRATMLLGLAAHGEHPDAQRWLDHFRTVKIQNELLPTFNRDLQGGGSREGTGYGTAMKNLFQLYDWWERSTGERLASRTPHTLASMAHLIHSIAPTLDRLAPTGDHARDSSAALFDYHREYLLVLMALFPEERLSGVARTVLEESAVPQMKNAFMYHVDFMYEQPDLPARPVRDLSTSYWGSGTGQLMTRSSWDASATFANFICGPYSESHAHRDQGSFVLFKGSWLATDPNVYSHSGIEQDEELHNLVRFESGGTKVKQGYGKTCLLNALADKPDYTYASANVTPIYHASPLVKKVEREFLFIKPGTLVVFDRTETAAAVRRTWTLNLAGRPTIEQGVVRHVSGRNRLDVHLLAPGTAEVSMHDWTAARRGMSAGTRLDVADDRGMQSQFLHVLSADGAVASATRSDAPGMIGADIKFSDGRSAIVRFPTSRSGGSLELRAADQSVRTSGALPTSVAAPPLFAN